VSWSFVDKPHVPILSPPMFFNPARNYLASLLGADIALAKPRRALDAGAGELRSFPLFPAGSYTGVGLEQSSFDAGLKRQAKRIARWGQPKLIVADLDGDVSTLGEFDLVVCTRTAFYFKNMPRTLLQLANLITENGRMLFDIPADRLDDVIGSGLVELFENVEVIAYDCLGVPEFPDCFDHLNLQSLKDRLQESKNEKPEIPQAELDAFFQHVVHEMTTAAPVSQCRYVYIRCFGRRMAP
jgi:hypothetical protein